MTSLFRRIARYEPTRLLNPQENRLTEAFAFVLEGIQGLARELVEDWFGLQIDAELPLTTRTQRATASGKFVDLELAFGSAVLPDLRVWVEIKHGADTHENQLESYLEDSASELHLGTRLVLLAPRQTMPSAPNGVRQVEWQTIGSELESRRRRSLPGSATRLLLNEFTTYLKEEGLMDAEALTAADSFVLARRPAADRATARLLELTDGRIRNEWGTPTNFAKAGGSRPNYGPGYWSVHAPSRLPSEKATDSWPGAGFEWGLHRDGLRTESRDAYVFGSGATFWDKRSSGAVKDAGAWLTEHRSYGFELVQDRYLRLWRFLYPEQLLKSTTLAQQAEELAGWVVESFDFLATRPLPLQPESTVLPGPSTEQDRALDR